VVGGIAVIGFIGILFFYIRRRAEVDLAAALAAGRATAQDGIGGPGQVIDNRALSTFSISFASTSLH